MDAVTINVLWADDDVLELRLLVRSESFSAATTIYSSSDLLQRVADEIIGFPASASDVRRFDLATAGDTASFEMSCVDSLGHIMLLARVADGESEVSQEAIIAVPIVAAAVDRFRDELREVASRRTDLARLQGDEG